ncbi:MAG TPA: RodZ domain-containing protein [Methylomirabilota bacterium]|nr:RodZ domain-containing protein [Methylomirabilota bacterium]
MDEQRTPATTKDSFGEHLRRERELRGVTLDEITAATRIGTRYLEALENEQWDRLPGGVFNRGFIRSIAHFLGLDEEDLLAEYMHATNGIVKPSSWASQTHPAAEPDRRWIPLVIILLVVIVLAAGGGWLGLQHYRAAKRTRAAAASAISAGMQAPAEPAALRPAPFATTPATDVPAGTPAGPARTGTAATPAPVPVSDPTAPLKLKIEAGKTTSVRVLADGVQLFDGMILAGNSQKFEAIDNFQVSARDAGALMLQLNGQTMPPIGPPGNPGTITLTYDSLTKTTGGNH